jgi:predicted DCC family thiol-disulfide oxidoreductase YuxK
MLFRINGSQKTAPNLKIFSSMCNLPFQTLPNNRRPISIDRDFCLCQDNWINHRSLAFAMTKAIDGSSWLLIYDGDCGLCRRFVSWLLARGHETRLQAVAYQEADLPPAMVRRAQHSVLMLHPDGKWEDRGRAVLTALSIAQVRYLGWLRYPPFIYLLNLGYRWVAQHRQLTGRLLQRLFHI